MKPLKIIKNRSDIGAGTRGSDIGIDALEIAAINKKYNFFNQHEFVDVKTHNESIYNKNKNTFAKRINFVKEQCIRVCDVTKKTLEENYFPLILSGDHSSALGTISGIKATYPDKKIGVVWIDAHADLHSPWSSPSGNIHGMPLAASLGLDNKNSSVNSIDDSTANNWNEIKNIGVSGAKLTPNNLIFFGVRDTEEPEEQIIKAHSIKNYTVEEVRYRALDLCVSEAIDKLDDVDLIYISFDVDSLDCDMISRGTGTPVQKGFSPKEVNSIIQQIMDTNKVCCLEVVEINPLLDDKKNLMAETAMDIIHSVFS